MRELAGDKPAVRELEGGKPAGRDSMNGKPAVRELEGGTPFVRELGTPIIPVSLTAHTTNAARGTATCGEASALDASAPLTYGAANDSQD